VWDVAITGPCGNLAGRRNYRRQVSTAARDRRPYDGRRRLDVIGSNLPRAGTVAVTVERSAKAVQPEAAGLAAYRVA